MLLQGHHHYISTVPNTPLHYITLHLQQDKPQNLLLAYCPNLKLPSMVCLLQSFKPFNQDNRSLHTKRMAAIPHFKSRSFNKIINKILSSSNQHRHTLEHSFYSEDATQRPL